MGQEARRIAVRDRGERSPFVSVIIPMRNEEEYIKRCLDSLLDQDYSHDRYEIVVVDGQSTDDSRRIVEEEARHSGRVRLLTNAHQTAPHGFNIGIQQAQGDMCIIFSAHAYAPLNFISKSVHYIQTTGADCVGGQVDIDSENTLARAVAKAMASPFGMGNVHFRSSNQQGFVDTVTFCTYRKEVFDRIGLFDETLTRNQDYELNYRVRKSGGRIFFTPDIKSSCYSRSSWRRLTKQYFQWGFWKVRTIHKHPASVKPRHVVAPAFLGSILLTAFGGFLWRPLWVVLGAILCSYALAALVFACRASRQEDWSFSFLLPIVFATMHLCWGAGFIWGVLTLPWPAERVPFSH